MGPFSSSSCSYQVSIQHCGKARVGKMGGGKKRKKGERKGGIIFHGFAWPKGEREPHQTKSEIKCLDIFVSKSNSCSLFTYRFEVPFYEFGGASLFGFFLFGGALFPTDASAENPLSLEAGGCNSDRKMVRNWETIPVRWILGNRGPRCSIFVLVWYMTVPHKNLIAKLKRFYTFWIFVTYLKSPKFRVGFLLVALKMLRCIIGQNIHIYCVREELFSYGFAAKKVFNIQSVGHSKVWFLPIFGTLQSEIRYL